jgi:peptide/nickel transport system substrate-binding protein
VAFRDSTSSEFRQAEPPAFSRPRAEEPVRDATHYADPAVDRLLKDASVENDPAKRVALFKEFQRIGAEEVPDLNLISSLFLTIYNTRIKDH